MTKLSIVITTYNRAILLEQLLNDISRQYSSLSPEEQSIELIIVDNNSGDDTKSTIYKFIEANTLSIKYVFEECQGISAARNAAIEKCQGNLIAFLHDDISLDDDWLPEAYRIACNCLQHEIGVYGGRSIPIWEDDLPEWLDIEPPYGVDQEVFHGHSYGDEERFYPFETEFGAARYPSGVNVFIRREIFINCGLFRTDLGANAEGGLGAHEDYEFFDYLAAINIPMLYVPQCIVFNHIKKEQLEETYVRTWYFKTGRSLYWVAHTDRLKRSAPELFQASSGEKLFCPEFTKMKIGNIPLYLHLKILYVACELLYILILFDKKKLHYVTFKLCKALGEMNAAVLLATKDKNKKFSFKDRIVKNEVLKVTNPAEPHSVGD